MLKVAVMFNNNKSEQSTEPIWRRTVPAIPVRDNLKTSYLQLSGMHGDHLPRLKKVERPEFSHKVRHYESVCRSGMMKNLNIMYREHKHVMRKLAHGQDMAFKEMCRVQRDRRRVQRTECVRRQEEFREKMKSHRMRTLLLNVVVKFRENVRRKKNQRALAQKVTEADGTSRRVPNDKLSTEKQYSSLSPIPLKENTKTSNAEVVLVKVDGFSFRERKGSLSRDRKSIKPVITTAENRERWDSEFNNNSRNIQDVDIPDITKKSRVLEVSKSVSKPVTKRKGNYKDISDTEPQPMEAPRTDNTKDETQHAEGTLNHSLRSSQDNVDSEMHTQMQNATSRLCSKRTSIFDNDEMPDYGRFTVGNPIVQGVPPTSTNVWSRNPYTIQESMDEDSETEQQSLPPLRRRKPGLARPPSSYLRDQLELFNQKDSPMTPHHLDSDFCDSGNSDVASGVNGHTLDSGNTVIDSSVPIVASLLFPGESDKVSQWMSSGLTLSLPTFSDTKSQASLTLSNSHDHFQQGQHMSNTQSFKTFSASKSNLFPINHGLKPKRPQPSKDKHISANMMWVLKQEEKSKKNWEKYMSEKEEKIVKYHKAKDGQYVSTAVNRRNTFSPPSYKEKHRQMKLLDGEKVKDTDRQERIDDFYKTIPAGEPPDEFIYEANSQLPKKKPSQNTSPVSKFGKLYDVFKDSNMVDPVHSDSNDAMKGVAYLRVRDDGSFQNEFE